MSFRCQLIGLFRFKLQLSKFMRAEHDGVLRVQVTRKEHMQFKDGLTKTRWRLSICRVLFLPLKMTPTRVPWAVFATAFILLDIWIFGDKAVLTSEGTFIFIL